LASPDGKSHPSNTNRGRGPVSDFDDNSDDPYNKNDDQGGPRRNKWGEDDPDSRNNPYKGRSYRPGQEYLDPKQITPDSHNRDNPYKPRVRADDPDYIPSQGDKFGKGRHGEDPSEARDPSKHGRPGSEDRQGRDPRDADFDKFGERDDRGNRPQHAKYQQPRDKGGFIDPDDENVKISKKDKNERKPGLESDPKSRDKQHELNPDDEQSKDKKRKVRPEKLDPFRQKIYNAMPQNIKGTESDQIVDDNYRPEDKPERHNQDGHHQNRPSRNRSEGRDHPDYMNSPRDNYSDRQDSSRDGYDARQKSPREEYNEHSKHQNDRLPKKNKNSIDDDSFDDPKKRKDDQYGKRNQQRDYSFDDPKHPKDASRANLSKEDDYYDDPNNSRGKRSDSRYNPSDDQAGKRNRSPREHYDDPSEGRIGSEEQHSKNRNKDKQPGLLKDRQGQPGIERHDLSNVDEEDEEEGQLGPIDSKDPSKPSGKSKLSDRRYSEMPGSKSKDPDRRHSQMPGSDSSRPLKPLSKDPKKNTLKDGKTKEGPEDQDNDSDEGNDTRFKNLREPSGPERKSILKKRDDAGTSKDRDETRPRGVVFSEDVKGSDDPTDRNKTDKAKPFKELGGSAGDEDESVSIKRKDGKQKGPQNTGKNKDHSKDFKGRDEDDEEIHHDGDHSDDEDGNDKHQRGRDIVNIPVKTYTRMRNLKALSDNLDEDLKEADNKDPETKEALEEQTTKVTDLGESIINDLAENNPNHRFIQEMKEEFREIKEEIGDDKKTDEEKQKAIEKLVKWQKKLKKLEVKEPKIKPEEKKQFRDMYKRHSFRALVDAPGKEPINIQKIQEGQVDERNLEEYVKVFLQKYTEKMEEMNSPNSRVYAKESTQALQTIEKVKKERPPEESKELIKLMATAILDKFKTEDEDLLSSMTNEEELKGKHPTVFNHFLRAANQLADIPFKTLDDIVSEPSTKINLFNIRKNQMAKRSEQEYKDKEADLFQLNSLEKDKQKIEELFINLGKEVLPPEQVKKEEVMYDSGFPDMDINFIPINTNKPKDSAHFAEEPDFKKTFSPDDSFGDDIKFGGTNYEATAVQKRFSMVQPNLIDSENEIEETSEDGKEKTQSPESLRAGIDYRDDLADKLELVIEGISNTQADTKMARQELKKHNKARTPLADPEKIELFDQLNKALEETNDLTKQGDDYKVPYEVLKRDIREKLQISSPHLPSEHNRGLIRMWGKYNRQLRKLKDETIALLNDIQNSPAMRANEPQTAEELELVKEELEDVQKVLRQETLSEDQDSKHVTDPNSHVVIGPEELEKEIKEQDKKHKEMDKKVEALTGKIENLRRASLMHPHLDPQKNKNNRFSTIATGTTQIKPKDNKSMIHALIQDQREEGNSDKEDHFEDEILEEDEFEDEPQPQETQTEKDLQKLKSQSAAALTSLRSDDEQAGERLARLEQTLAQPRVAALVKAADSQAEADDVQLAIKSGDQQEVDKKLEKLYEKISKAQLTPEQASEIEQKVQEHQRAIEDQMDEEAKMDLEIKQRREAKQRAEKEVKNIQGIVEQLKQELKELKARSEEMDSAKRYPTKLRHLVHNIEECQEHLEEVPMPDPDAISQTKQTTREANSLMPKEEEKTPENIADLEEFEGLTKQIDKNVDQLAVNMTDVAEFRLKNSADNLVDLGKERNVDLKAPNKGGTAPENSEDLTEGDREDLQKALEKLQKDAEGAKDCVEEWYFHSYLGCLLRQRKLRIWSL
jgi:hypothetical protein